MPAWVWSPPFLLGLPIATVIVAILGGIWARQRYPAFMYSIWLTGVAVPLFMAALTVVPGVWTGHWYFPPILLGVWMGTSVWVGQTVARDPTEPQWGSRSDLLGRFVLVVVAACLFLMGVEAAHDRYGSRGFVYLFYGCAVAALVLAVVAKPRLIRAWSRRPTQPRQGAAQMVAQ